MDHPQSSFINCHTHVFTGDHVPPHLGKKMLPGPLGYIFTIPRIVHFFRWWYGTVIKAWYHNANIRYLRKKYYEAGLWLHRHKLMSMLLKTIGWLLTLQALLIIIRYFEVTDWAERTAPIANYILPENGSWWPLILIVVVLLFPTGRNFIWFISTKIFKLLKILPGPKTQQYIVRYLSIGRYAFHQDQWTIFDTLKRQYPLKTKFVILPMDMDYMEAGKPVRPYMEQLQELRELHKSRPGIILPFVFADPRRIAADAGYLDTIKACIQEDGFRGIKTYPALGYYPFDKDLLPLMLYACEHGIPVLNHCIRGVIFYRGSKKDAWNYHPVFRQAEEDEKLQLFQKKNVNYSANFTHPLNYLCLLDEKLLRKLLLQYNDPHLFELFGYTDANTKLGKDLSKLKICFGHFGGEDEWARYLKSDRSLWDNSLQFHPERGLDFSKETAIEGIWRYASWFSIIYSLMLQYKNVYADISYILHDAETHPLLKNTLLPQSGIADRVLFGTDFYVVRSEQSDKSMWANMVAALSPQELTAIACVNPRRFLENDIHGPVAP